MLIFSNKNGSPKTRIELEEGVIKRRSSHTGQTSIIFAIDGFSPSHGHERTFTLRMDSDQARRIFQSLADDLGFAESRYLEALIKSTYSVAEEEGLDATTIDEKLLDIVEEQTAAYHSLRSLAHQEDTESPLLLAAVKHAVFLDLFCRDEFRGPETPMSPVDIVRETQRRRRKPPC